MKGLSVLMPAGGAIETDEWRQRSFKWIVARYEALLPDAELCFGNSEHTPYNRSAARNDAFAQSSGDMLLVADADTVFNVAQIVRAITLIREAGAAWVIPYDGADRHPDRRGIGRYYNLSQRATVFLIENADPGQHVEEPNHPEAWDHKITSWAGLLMLPRSAWEAVGGYDESFTGWGYEDNAFRAALDHRVGPYARVKGEAGYVMHAWHPAPEEDCFGQPDIQANRELCAKYEKGLLP